MNKIEATLTPRDHKSETYRRAAEGHFRTLLKDSTQVYVDGKLRIHFEVLPEVPADLLRAFQTINYGETFRTNGLKVTSRTIGSLPRVTIRRDFCTASSLTHEHPEAHTIFTQYAYRADARYCEVNPVLYAHHREVVEKVKPCWRLGGTVFTSGIANHDNALDYHLDKGNFPNLWSAMYALSYDCAGGLLSVPELDLGFSFQRPSLIMFDGQGLLHGVTPLEKRSRESYRYTVVYYAMQQLCHCGTPEEELARIRRVRTEREVKRSKRG